MSGVLNLITVNLRSVGYRIVGNAAELNLSRKAFNSALSNFATTARNADVALIYYAGHGAQVDGENYLIPVDADVQDRDDVKAQGISLSAILRSVESLGTRLNLVILDACRDDPFPTLAVAARDLSNRGFAQPGLAASVAPKGSYDGTTYSIPLGDRAGASLEVLGVLKQLVAISSSAKGLPQSTVLSVITQ